MAQGSRDNGGSGKAGGSGNGKRRPVPQAAVDQVLGSIAITEVVKAKGVALKRVGREQVGLCPFHDDSNASMSVNDAKGIFKCFSCGAGGDAIQFVKLHDGVDFRDALGELAAMGGVDVPELRDGGQGQGLSDDERAALEKKRAEAARRAEKKRKAEEAERAQAEAAARELFEACPPDDGSGLAGQYLMGRGIDTSAAWLAGFCTDLRGGAHVPERVQDDAGNWHDATAPAMVGLLRDPEGKPVGVQRVYLDTARGVTKRAGGASKKMLGTAGVCRLFQGDVLEYESPRLIVAEGIETAAAIMAATHGAPVWAVLSTSGLVNFELPQELRGNLHGLTIAADLDRSDAGRLAALKCAARVREQSPATVVRIAMPTPELALGLFDADGGPKGKSVDWLDVYQAAGAGVVAEAMMDALEVRDDQESGDEGGEHEGGDDAQWAGGLVRDGMGGWDGVRPPSTTTGSGGGGHERYCFEHDDHAAFARKVLVDLYAPPAEERDASRWMIAWYDEKWYRRLPGEARWRPDDEIRVHAQVWQQLREYDVIKRENPKPLTPTAQTVRGVMEAIRGEVAVYAEQMPCWAPSTFDRKGRPAWGVSAHVYDDVQGKVDPKAAIATRSGILDADAWAEGEIRVEPLTPLWFSTGTLPHVLPLEAMQGAIDDAACEEGLEGVELFEEMCPSWMAFLRSVVEPLADQEDDWRWMNGLQEMFGYMLTYDRTMQAVFMMPGPPRSGKSTMQRALEAVVSKEQIASSTLGELENRWKPLEFRNKTVCLMGDITVGNKTDAIKCVEMMKRVRGGDRMSIEKHHKGFVEAATPPIAFWITTNELPKLPDASGALVATMICLPTFKSFVGKEDRELLSRIMAEGAGIMVWALFGLRRLRKRKAFTKCAAGEVMLDELKAMGSPVFSFVTEECFTGPKQGVASSALYQIYTEWSKQNGYGTKAVGQFGAALKAACPWVERKRLSEGNRPYVYMGLRPATVGDESDRVIMSLDELRTPGELSDTWATRD